MMRILQFIAFTPVFLLVSCSIFVPASTPAPASTEFEGFYTSSFEVSSFVKCGMNSQSGYGQGYWLVSTTEFQEKFRRTLSGAAGTYGPKDNPRVFDTVYVRFTGTLSPKGNYGHLGAYSNEVTVIKVIEMKTISSGFCRGTP
jgi:hypothetical protein